MADNFLGRISEYTGRLVDRISELPEQAREKGSEMLRDFQAYLDETKNDPNASKAPANIRDWLATVPDKAEKYGQETIDAVTGFWENNVPDDLKPKKGRFLDNNKGALGGALMLGLVGMLLMGGGIAGLLMALVGFLLGSAMDGKGGMLGGLFGGGDDKSTQTPGGQSQAPAGQGQGQGQGQGEGQGAAPAIPANDPRLQSLDPELVAQRKERLRGEFIDAVNNSKVSVLNQDERNATIQIMTDPMSMAGNRPMDIQMRGEIRGNDFVVTGATVNGRNMPLPTENPVIYRGAVKDGRIDIAPLETAIKEKGLVAQIVNDNRMDRVFDIAARQSLVREMEQQAQAQNAPTPAEQTPAAAPAAAAATVAAQPPATPQQPAANLAQPAAAATPAQPAAAPAEQAPVAAAPQAPAGRNNVAIMGDGGKPITKLYLNEDGTAVVPGQESSAAVILQGRYEQGGQLFRVESYAARKPDGSFMPMKNVYENGMISPVTLTVADNQIDLSAEGNKRQNDKMITLANSYRDNVANANETRSRMERLAFLSRSADVSLVNSQQQANGNDLVTVRYTAIGQDGKEYTAMLTGEQSYSTSTTTTRGTGLDWANETRTTTTTGNLRITSGSLLDSAGKPYGGNFIDKPIMISGLSVGSNGINYAAMPKIKPLETKAEERIAQLNKPAEQPAMVAGEQPAPAIPGQLRGGQNYLIPM